MIAIYNHSIKLMLMFVLSLTVYGCSGSGSSSTSTTMVNGTVAAGPASGAVVSVKANGVEVAKSTASAADGTYTVAIPTSELAKDLVFEASGGTFPDEATATTGISLGTFSAHVAAGTLVAGSQVTIDPSSTIIQRLVAAGKSRTEATTLFTTAFGYSPDASIKPAFATFSSASTTSQRLIGLHAAAFSQLTKDLGLAPGKQFELVQALAADLLDGTLDGLTTGGTAVTTASGAALPADIGNCFAKALMTFQTSTLNKSKLTPDKIGAPSFAKTALTANYKVEYIPGSMAAAQGKTTFKIKLSNRSDSSAATGKTITLIPKMYMAGHSHGSPVGTVIETATAGTYDCTIYYLMASGPGMGIWELKVMIGMETAIFYPPVAMSMGTTTRAILKGQSDLIASMMGMGTKRTYSLFNDGSTFGMSSTLKLFIAAVDDAMMMMFPAVSNGSSLHDSMGVAWTVAGMTVEASTDNGSSWNSLTDDGGGHWSVSGLSGLGSGGTIKLRLILNSEQKTTDGLAVSAGANDAATFTVATGM